MNTGAFGIEAVDPSTPGALVCGTCGKAWLEDITPAGRCPWEHEHADLDSEVNAFRERLHGIAAAISLGMQCSVLIGHDDEHTPGRFYFQIKCYRQDVITGLMGYGYGGKAYLSPHASDSELIQTVFGLYKGYWEHEARETFLLTNAEGESRRPFGPHIDTWALFEVARRVDVRSARHVEDRNNPGALTPSRRT